METVAGVNLLDNTNDCSESSATAMEVLVVAAITSLTDRDDCRCTLLEHFAILFFVAVHDLDGNLCLMLISRWVLPP